MTDYEKVVMRDLCEALKAILAEHDGTIGGTLIDGFWITESRCSVTHGEEILEEKQAWEGEFSDANAKSL